MVQLQNKIEISDQIGRSINDIVARVHLDGRMYIGRLDAIKTYRGGIEEKTIGTVLEIIPQNDQWHKAERFRDHITTTRPLYLVTKQGIDYLKQNSFQLGGWYEDYLKQVVKNKQEFELQKKAEAFLDGRE